MAQGLFTATDSDGYTLAFEDRDGDDPANITVSSGTGNQATYYLSRDSALGLAAALTRWANG